MSGNHTKWIWTNSPGASGGGAPAGKTDPGSNSLGAGGGTTGGGTNPPIKGFDDEPTRDVRNLGGTEVPTDDDVTRHAKTAYSGEDDKFEPVVGWLVVVKGPGLGRSINIGAGLSTIGRAPEQRVALPFGDASISRSHARMIYDATSRKFYLMSGDGKNLTRVNGKLLLHEHELQGGELITLGNTEVRFVPFCGTFFDWADVPDDENDGSGKQRGETDADKGDPT
ncbi:MAG: FHA domain-containing protein [Pseudomonadota bacterium]